MLKKKELIIKELENILLRSESDLAKIDPIYEQGIKNGVELRRVTKKEIESDEKELSVHAGIFSPNTGIIDVPELITALEGDIQHNQDLSL